MTVTWSEYGRTDAQEPVHRAVLANRQGMQVGVLTWGALVDSILVPDRHGALGDVVLGFDTLAPYLARHPNFGVVVGRYANRIAHARFSLGGTDYHLAANNGRNALHGGVHNFARKVWRAEAGFAPGTTAIRLHCTSPDGEEGYPGNLAAAVTYRLDDDNALHIRYEAHTDRRTVVNLTNHSYFNLAGHDDVLQHEVAIFADRFLPVDAHFIPTGELRAVAGTAMDFRAPRRISDALDPADPQIRLVKDGYDHTFVLGDAGPLKRAARVYEAQSGRVLDVSTTQPGVQFYTGNSLDGSFVGKSGARYDKYAGLCLETQHFPDSPNQPAFPSTVLDPGANYQHEAIYRFSVRA